MPLERVQVRVEMVSPRQVIAAAIDEHVERFSDSAELRHISCDEPNTRSSWVSGRPLVCFCNRCRREVHSDRLKSVLGQKQSLDATAAAKV
jgi:hypothetical protein